MNLLVLMAFCCLSVAWVMPGLVAQMRLELARAVSPAITSGDPSSRSVALTFDDGPNPDATPRILTALEHAHAHATFFVVGRLAAAYPGLIARMVRDGDAVESHSWSHEYRVLEPPWVFHRSLERVDASIESGGAQHPAYFRPPYGVLAPWTMAEARADGEDVVLWSVPLSDDWEQPGTALIIKRTLAYARPGAIMVLHDGNEGKPCAGMSLCDRRQEIAATPVLIRALRARGLRCVTIPELLAVPRVVSRR